MAGERGRLVRHERSQALLREARGLVFPGASQTLSKGPSQWVQGVAPLRRAGPRARASGTSTATSTSTTRWRSARSCSATPTRRSTRRSRASSRDGITFTLMHPLEVEVAERIVGAVPGVEAVRFGKTGSDAHERRGPRGARAHRPRPRARRRLPRLARLVHRLDDARPRRARRGRRRSPRRSRSTTSTRCAPALDAHAGPGRRASCSSRRAPSRPDPATSQASSTWPTSTARSSIFDEVITGFRLAPGGAQERYGVDARPLVLRQGARQRHADRRGRRPWRVHDVLRGHLLLRHARRRGAVAGRGAGDARRDRRRAGARAPWRLGGVLQDGLAGAHRRARPRASGDPSGAAPWTLVLVASRIPTPEGLPAKTLLQQELLSRGVLYNGSHFISCVAHRRRHRAGRSLPTTPRSRVLARRFPTTCPQRSRERRCRPCSSAARMTHARLRAGSGLDRAPARRAPARRGLRVAAYDPVSAPAPGIEACASEAAALAGADSAWWPARPASTSATLGLALEAGVPGVGREAAGARRRGGRTACSGSRRGAPCRSRWR